MAVDDESLKARRLIDDSDMGMSSINKEKAMTEDNTKIPAGMLLGVDMTEVYYLERFPSGCGVWPGGGLVHGLGQWLEFPKG